MPYVLIKMNVLVDEKDSDKIKNELRQWNINNSVNMSRLNIKEEGVLL